MSIILIWNENIWWFWFPHGEFKLKIVVHKVATKSLTNVNAIQLKIQLKEAFESITNAIYWKLNTERTNCLNLLINEMRKQFIFKNDYL